MAKNNEILLWGLGAAAVYFLVIKPRTTAVVPGATAVAPVTTTNLPAPAGSSLLSSGSNLLTSIINKINPPVSPGANLPVIPDTPPAIDTPVLNLPTTLQDPSLLNNAESIYLSTIPAGQQPPTMIPPQYANGGGTASLTGYLLEEQYN